MKMSSLKDLWRGVRRSPLKAAGYAFTSFSVIFTVVKAVTHFVPGIKIEGGFALFGVIVLSLILGLKKVWKPSKISMPIANSNTCFEIIFGDIFDQDGLRVISVSEYFDSKFGRPVSEKSLHGIFLQKCFGGHPESFDRLVDEELRGIAFEVTSKAEGKNKAYPIGTTALIGVNEDLYLLSVLAKADPQTCKAYSDVTMMWAALDALWERTRVEAGGNPVNLPLIGSGLSGLGLPTRDLLNLLILSAITATKEKEVTQKIRVVLHRDRFDDLDLRDVKKYWEEK